MRIILLVLTHFYFSRGQGTRTTSCRNILNTVSLKRLGNAEIERSGSSINVTCVNNTTLEGSTNLTCLVDGTWSPPFPRCLMNCPELPKTPFIFSKESLTLIKPDTFNTTEGTTVSLSCLSGGYIVDGPTTITCESTGRWSHTVPECKIRPKIPERQWLKIMAIAGPLGIILVVLILVVGKLLYKWREGKKQHLETMELYDLVNNNKTYKVWTVGRSHKKLIVADDLKDLVAKASKTFDLNGKRPGRLVLEEDGTEVTNDTGMILSHDKIFIILPYDQEWAPALYTEDEKLRLTFDVCTFDRKQRQLFLAVDLSDLKNQVTKSFGYDVTSFCLEFDGSVIDDDMPQKYIAGQLIMALRTASDWSQKPTRPYLRNGDLQHHLPQLDLSSSFRRNTRNLFKVWTEDQQCKRVIHAESLVDLHIKAARTLHLNPPIGIFELENNVSIVDDGQLLHHKDDILIARETKSIHNHATSSVYSYPTSRSAAEYAEYFPGSFKSRDQHRNYSNNTYF